MGELILGTSLQYMVLLLLAVSYMVGKGLSVHVGDHHCFYAGSSTVCTEAGLQTQWHHSATSGGECQTQTQDHQVS